MLRKTLIALAAVATVGLLATDMAQARGFGGHGGFVGGGHFGGFRGGGGGFGRGFGYGVGGFGLGVGLGYGVYGPYGYYGGYGPYSEGGYYADDGGGCYVVRQRVHTRYGWRVRPVEVCG